MKSLQTAISAETLLKERKISVPFFNPCGWSTAAYTDSYEDYEPSGMFLKYCGMFGVSEEDVRLLLDFGYDTDTIEEMLMDTAMLEEALAEIKNAYCVE